MNREVGGALFGALRTEAGNRGADKEDLAAAA